MRLCAESRVREIILGAIRGEDISNYAESYAIIELAKNEIETMRRVICPFCNKKFDNVNSLIRHLRRGRCRSAFEHFVKQTYETFKQYVSMRVHKGNYYYIGSHKFETSKEAFQFFINHVLRRGARNG